MRNNAEPFPRQPRQGGRRVFERFLQLRRKDRRQARPVGGARLHQRDHPRRTLRFPRTQSRLGSRNRRPVDGRYRPHRLPLGFGAQGRTQVIDRLDQRSASSFELGNPADIPFTPSRTLFILLPGGRSMTRSPRRSPVRMHYCSIGTSRTIDFYPGGPRVDAMSRGRRAERLTCCFGQPMRATKRLGDEILYG